MKKDKNMVKMKKGEKRTEKKPVTTDSIQPEFRKPTWTKDILLGLVDVLLVVGLLYLLSQLSGIASKVSELRSIGLKGTANIQEFELMSFKEDIEKMDSAFIDEERMLADFVGEIEKLKGERTVVDFNFQNEDPISDKTKVFGFPIVISMSGNWEDIAADLVTIQSLPYLFRPVAFNAEEQVGGGVEVEYGGILYVNENFE